MKIVNIDREAKPVRDFFLKLAGDNESKFLQLNGKPVAMVTPPYGMNEQEKKELIAEAKELMRRARKRNKGVPAKTIKKEVDTAVAHVRRKNRKK